MNPSLARSGVIVLATLWVTLAGAAPGGAPDGADVQALFEQRRALEIRSHAERIRILEEADACIRSAPDFRAYRACEEQEESARQLLRDELRPQLQALRDHWQALRRPAPR
jgi:hypothetical protein